MSMRGLERPLRLGEILDRAVTLSVRRFPKLLGLVALVVLPLSIVQSFGVDPIVSYLFALTMATKAGHPNLSTVLAVRPTVAPFDYLMTVIGVLLAPLISGATTIAIARSLAGDEPTIAASYASALRRWPSVLAGLALWLVLAMLVLGTAIGAAALVMVRKAGEAPDFGGVLALAGFGLVVLLPVFALIYVLAILTATGIMLETYNPFVAVGRSFARVFTRREFRRAMVLTFAMIVSTLVFMLLGGFVANTAFALVRWDPIFMTLAQLANAVSTVFTAAVFTMYYYDVRLRREGSDLLVAPSVDLAVPIA